MANFSASKNTGDTLTAPEWNQTGSINNLIQSTGQTLSTADLNQSGKAAAQYGSGNFFTDSGAANAYILSPIGSMQSPAAYFDGMEIRFRAANASNAASTVNVNSLGNKAIKLNDGTTDISNQINTTEDVILRFDLANDCFILPQLATSVLVPIGSIITYAVNTPPTGFLECNGAAINRTTYANLFAAIGTTFGIGDGVTTFNIPDLRGEFLRGWDNGRGIDPARVFGSAQAFEIESHTHNINNYSGTGTPGQDSISDQVTGAASGGPSVGFTIALATGGSETRPRNIALTYCIKY